MDEKAKKIKKIKKMKKTEKDDKQKKKKIKDKTPRSVSGGGWFASQGPPYDAQGNPLKVETRMVYWEP
jgi:hypothetical protein